MTPAGATRGGRAGAPPGSSSRSRGRRPRRTRPRVAMAAAPAMEARTMASLEMDGCDRSRLYGGRRRHRVLDRVCPGRRPQLRTTTQGALRRVRLGWLLPASWAGPGRDVDATLARSAPGGRPRRSAASSRAGPWAWWRSTSSSTGLAARWTGKRRCLSRRGGAGRWYPLLRACQGRDAGGEQGPALRGSRVKSGPRSQVGVVRRMRELMYAGLGLVALGWLSARTGPSRARPSTSLRSSSGG